MERKLEEILEQVEQLQPYEQQRLLKHLLDKYGQSDPDAMVVGDDYSFWRCPADDVYDESTDDREGKAVPSLQAQLAEANDKVNARIDEIWAQAEENLNKLEEEYARQKEEKRKP